MCELLLNTLFLCCLPLQPVCNQLHLDCFFPKMFLKPKQDDVKIMFSPFVNKITHSKIHVQIKITKPVPSPPMFNY